MYFNPVAARSSAVWILSARSCGGRRFREYMALTNIKYFFVSENTSNCIPYGSSNKQKSSSAFKKSKRFIKISGYILKGFNIFADLKGKSSDKENDVYVYDERI